MPTTSTGGNTVQLVINVVDANSGEVIERVTKNVDALGTAGTRAGQQVAEGMAQVSGSAAGAAQAVVKGADAQAQAVQRSAAAQQQAFREVGSAHANMIAQMTKVTGAAAFPRSPASKPQEQGSSDPARQRAALTHANADGIIPRRQAVGEYVEMLANVAAAENKLTAQRMGVTEATVQGWKRAGAAWADYERTVDRSTAVRRSTASSATPAAPQRIAANPFTVGNTGAGTLSTGFTGAAVSELKQVSAAADEAGNHGEQAFKKIGGHAMTSLDNVRLLRDDLGIKIPRGMEMAISRSAALSKVIGGIGSGLVALGAFELAFHVGKEIYDFFDKLRDVNTEMRKYQAQANENATQKLFDTQSIEETNALLKQTTGLMAGLDLKRLQAGVGPDNSGGLMQYFMRFSANFAAYNTPGAGINPQTPIYNRDDDKQRASLAAQNDLLQERRQAIDARRAVDQQEAKASQDGMRLTGRAADAAARQNAIQLATLKQQQAQKEAVFQRDQVLLSNSQIRAQNPGKSDDELRSKGLASVPVVAPNLGEQDRLDAQARAQGEYTAKGVAAANKESEEVGRLRREAQVAGLAGERKYQQDLLNIHAEFQDRVRYQGLSPAAATQMENAAKLKLTKEYEQAVRDAHQETIQIQMQADEESLTGLARIDAERRRRAESLAYQNSKGTLSDQDYLTQSAANQQGAGTEAKKAQDDYNQHFQQTLEDRTNSTMTANQRVLADTRRMLAEMQKAYDALYGDLAKRDPNSPLLTSARSALQGGQQQVQETAAKEMARNNRQVADETRKLQLEAGRGGGGNTFAQRSTEIQSQAQDQLRAVQEREDAARNAGELENVRQFEDQKAAIQQIARNKELDLVREQRDKLAGMFEGFFSNPLEALKRQGEGIASKAAADLVMGRKPGSDDAGSGLGALLGGVGRGGGLRDVVHPTFQRNSGMPAGRGAYESAGEVLPPAARAPQAVDAPVRATQQVTIEAGSAVVNVSSANISGAGGGNGRDMGSNTVGAPSAAVRGIASGGYAPTGDGGFFNVGGGSGSGEMGSGAGAAPDSSSNPFSDIDGGTASGVGSAAYSGTGSPGVSGALDTAQSVFGSAKSLGQNLGIFGSGSSTGSASSPFSDIGSDLGVFGGNPSDGSTSLASITSASDPFGASGTSNPFSAAAGGGSSALGAVSGAAGGALGVFSAFEGKGGVMGGLQGALSGAQVGAEFGGPAGAAIGAVVGGVLGFIGHGARVQAQHYYWKELKPRIDAEMLGFSAGTADYQSVYDDISKSDTEAKQKTREMGSGAVSYYNDTIHPALQKDLQKLTREQKAGRQQFGMSAAQFHLGGRINTFGSMATSNDEGWFHGKLGETVLNQQATMSHGDVAALMNAGVSRSDLAEYMGSSPTPQRAATGDEYHFHLSALDTRNLDTWVQGNGHKFRAAINSSYAENSGGAD